MVRSNRLRNAKAPGGEAQARSPAGASIQLKRTTKGLLSRVNGQSREDYNKKSTHKGVQKPIEIVDNDDEDDLLRSPASSDQASQSGDEQSVPPVSKRASKTKIAEPHRTRANAKAPPKKAAPAPQKKKANIRAPRGWASVRRTEESDPVEAAKEETQPSPPSNGKRKRGPEPATADSTADDEPLFQGIPSSSQPKITYRSSQPINNLFSTSSQDRKTTKKAKPSEDATAPKSKRAIFKEPPPLYKPKAQFKVPGASLDRDLSPPPASSSLIDQVNELLGHESSDDSLSEPDEDMDPYADLQHTDPSLNARCPVCKAPVTKDSLIEWNGGDLSTWRAKSSFCKSHKEEATKKRAESAIYPDIDWNNLPERIASFDKQIGAILDNTRTSHYKAKLERRISKGESHTAFNKATLLDVNASDTVVPGYYGGRGARMMQEHILHTFADQIRASAVTDPVIPSVGASGYVQCVLAPELAVWLVMADYAPLGGISEERARQVISESADVGELLHADGVGSTQAPVVLDDSEDEELQ